MRTCRCMIPAQKSRARFSHLSPARCQPSRHPGTRPRANTQPPATAPKGVPKPKPASHPFTLPRSLNGLAANMRKAEEDLHARQQALRLYGEALDNAARGLPRSLRYLAPTIAQVLGFGDAPHTTPLNSHNSEATKPPRASGQSGAPAAGTYAGAAARGASQPGPTSRPLQTKPSGPPSHATLKSGTLSCSPSRKSPVAKPRTLTRSSSS